MTYYSKTRLASVFFPFFNNNERKKHKAATDAEIKRLTEETLRLANEAQEQTNKVNKLIDDNPGGIVELIYYAIGNDRRNK